MKSFITTLTVLSLLTSVGCTSIETNPYESRDDVPVLDIIELSEAISKFERHYKRFPENSDELKLFISDPEYKQSLDLSVFRELKFENEDGSLKVSLLHNDGKGYSFDVQPENKLSHPLQPAVNELTIAIDELPLADQDDVDGVQISFSAVKVESRVNGKITDAIIINRWDDKIYKMVLNRKGIECAEVGEVFVKVTGTVKVKDGIRYIVIKEFEKK